MPMPERRSGESHDDFMGRCVPADDVQELAREGTETEGERNEKAVAICFSQSRKGGSAPSRNLVSLRAAPELIRHAHHEGRDHLVVPAVLLTEGVIKGLGQPQPELALASEFADPPEAWNGRPVVIREHPSQNGQGVSANSPHLHDTVAVGKIFNAHVQDRRLRAEIWIDTAKARRLGGDAISMVRALERGEQVEVSTGYWAETEPISGVHDGKVFAAVQRNIRPDHLLLVPLGERGACSWEDGCGAPRVNSGCCDACARGDPCEQEKTMDPSEVVGLKLMFSANRKRSDVDRRMAVEAALRTEGDSSGEIVALFDDSVVYHAFDADAGFTMLRRGFEIGSDGTVTLGKSRQQVRPETSFVPVRTNQDASDEETGETDTPLQFHRAREHPDSPASADLRANSETKAMTDQVAALIANQRTPFTDADAEWLKAAPDERIQALIESYDVPEETETVAETNEESPIATVDDLLKRCQDGDFRAFVEGGMRLARERKDGLVARIKAHSSNRFTEETLRGKSQDELESIAALIGEAAPPDYGGRGGPRTMVANQDDLPPPMPKLFASKEN